MRGDVKLGMLVGFLVCTGLGWWYYRVNAVKAAPFEPIAIAMSVPPIDRAPQQPDPAPGSVLAPREQLVAVAPTAAPSVNQDLYLPVQPQTRRELQLGNPPVTHFAAAGETIAEIAELVGLPAKDIVRFNRDLTTTTRLREGQRVLIPEYRTVSVANAAVSAGRTSARELAAGTPGGQPLQPAANPAGLAPAAGMAPAAGVAPVTGGQTYTVVSGDSLWKIAKKVYGRATPALVQQIQKANNLSGTALKIGQALTIPPKP